MIILAIYDLFLQVCGIEWGQDDYQLVSCGMDGAVFVWNTQTGKPVSDCIIKTCSYTGIGFSSDAKTILVVGTNGSLKEIQDFQVTNVSALFISDEFLF